MPRKVFYGSYRNQRNQNTKKKVIAAVIILAAVLVAAGIFMAMSGAGIGPAMQQSVQEITQLKMQLKEKDDQIAALQTEIEQYKQELASRPAPSATPIPPPNDEVSAGQTTPVPSAAPTKKPSKAAPTKRPSKTAAPTQTKAPQIPTQPPAVAPTQPPAAPPSNEPQPPAQPPAEGQE